MNVFATEWTGRMSVNSKFESSDNKRLTTNRDNEEDVVGAVISTTGNLTAQTERSMNSLDTTFRFLRYDGDSDLDSDDQIFRLRNRYMWEKAAFNLNTGYKRESTLITELEDSGILNTDARNRRVQFDIAPSIEYFATEADQLTLGYSFTDVEFPGSNPLSDTDYEYWATSLGWVRSINERLALLSNVYYTDYEAELSDAETQSVGLDLGFSYAFSETLQTRFTAGYRDSDFENTVFGVRTSGSEDGSLLAFDLNKEYINSELGINISRTLSPSSSGVVFERDEINLNFDHNFAHNIFSSIEGRWFSNESLNSNQNFDDRDYYSGLLELGKRINPTWSVSGQYIYRYQEFDFNDRDAESHTGLLYISFKPQKRTLF